MADDQIADGAQQAAPSSDDGNAQAAPLQDSKPITFTQEQADALVTAAVEKATQDFRTWSGRRDKALIDQLASTIDERMTSQKAITGDGKALGPNFDFDNPMESIEKILSQRERQKQTEMQRFNDAALASMGKYMDTDVMFKDQEFGKKVIESAFQNLGRLRRDIPPDVAGPMLIKDTVLELGREKIAGGVPQSKSAGIKTLFGSVSPPAAPQKQKAVYSGPKLSDQAAKLADKWGYDADSLNKLFPNEK